MADINERTDQQSALNAVENPVPSPIPVADYTEHLTDAVTIAHTDNDQIMILRFDNFSPKTVDGWMNAVSGLRQMWPEGVPTFLGMDVSTMKLSEVGYFINRIKNSSSQRPDINAYLCIILSRSMASQLFSSLMRSLHALNPNTRLQIVNNREDALRWLRYHAKRLTKVATAQHR